MLYKLEIMLWVKAGCWQLWTFQNIDPYKFSSLHLILWSHQQSVKKHAFWRTWVDRHLHAEGTVSCAWSWFKTGPPLVIHTCHPCIGCIQSICALYIPFRLLHSFLSWYHCSWCWDLEFEIWTCTCHAHNGPHWLSTLIHLLGVHP